MNIWLSVDEARVMQMMDLLHQHTSEPRERSGAEASHVKPGHTLPRNRWMNSGWSSSRQKLEKAKHYARSIFKPLLETNMKFMAGDLRESKVRDRSRPYNNVILG